ncbi:MAG: leucine-rich repeat domain-containing protein [Flavobacteriales bacterium]|nr:leucine-rich repeat domain-containing protein [Flavobacteriales bacterium]
MKKTNQILSSVFTLVLLITLSLSNQAIAQEEVTIEMSDLMFDDQYYDVLSKAMAKKDHVKYLDIAMQDLKSFPKELCTLPNVERLSIGFNYIRSIPADIAKMEKLVFLDISGMHGDITLPAELAKLTNLKEIKMLDMLNADSEKRIVARITELLPDCKIVTGHTK